MKQITDGGSYRLTTIALSLVAVREICCMTSVIKVKIFNIFN